MRLAGPDEPASRQSWRPGSGHPARGDVADLRSVDVRLEGSADCVDHSRASSLIRVVKHSAKGSESARVPGQLRLGQRAFEVDCLDIDLDPAAPGQDVVDSAGI